MINAVNGTRGSAKAIFEECKKLQTLALTVQKRIVPMPQLLPPARIGGQYKVVLDARGGDSVGLHTGRQQDRLLIKGVVGGIALAWNQASRNFDSRIEPGDCIVEVNGARGSAIELVQQCKQRQILNMTLVQPLRPFHGVDPATDGETYHVVLDSGQDGLGLQTAKNGESLLIKGIIGGAALAWNLDRGNNERQLEPGHQILAINGIQGAAVALVGAYMNACRTRQLLDLLVWRPRSTD